MKNIILIICCLALLNPVCAATLRPKFRIKLKQWRQMGAIQMTFDGSGALYLAYRQAATETAEFSSTLTVQVYDGHTGRKKADAAIETPVVEFPRYPKAMAVSPDGRRLLIADGPPGSVFKALYLSVLRVDSLSQADSMLVPEEKRYIVAGFTDDSQAVRVASSNGRVAERVQLRELEAGSLVNVASEVIVENPSSSRGFELDPWGGIWFDGSRTFAPQTLPINTVSVPRIIRNGSVVFLPDAVFGFVIDGSILRIHTDSDDPVAVRPKGRCAFAIPFSISADRRVVANECRENEWSVWAHRTKAKKRRAVVFDTKTLSVIAEIPVSRKARPDMAVRHRDGRVLVATLDFPGRLSVYEFSIPK